jgi:hypothetical protein
MFHEYYLPNVDFGLADCESKVIYDAGGRKVTLSIRDFIVFEVDGLRWTLRKLVMWDGMLAPADVVLNKAAEQNRGREKRELSHDCLLQVSAHQITSEHATELAWDICWLLQLALGQRVRWVERGEREGDNYRSVQGISTNAPKTVSKNNPLSNYADGVIQRYLEGAIPLYRKNSIWWRITLDWFAIGYESADIQHVGLICSMLLDRIAALLFEGAQFEKQIDPELDEKLAADSLLRKCMEKQLTQGFKEITPNWNDQRSEKLIDVVLRWNREPPYPEKIKTVFAKSGLPVPDGKLLQNRHALAHGGELRSKTDALAFYKEITDLVITLLFKMLGYQGRYYVLGVGEKKL